MATPLEKALNRQRGAKCSNCKKRVIVNGVDYCKHSGKLILPMHIDADRSVQCKDIWEAKDV